MPDNYRNIVLVATWNWIPGVSNGRSIDQRVQALEDAVRITQLKLNKLTLMPNAPAMGLIQAIFVAPEYFFEMPFSGRCEFDLFHTGRGMGKNLFERVTLRMLAMSRAYPRILIIPGTINWLDTLTLSEIKKQAKIYLRISERLVGFSGKSGVDALIKIVCENVMMDENNLLRLINKDGLTKKLKYEEVFSWWKENPYIWGWALHIVREKLPKIKSESGNWNDKTLKPYGYDCFFSDNVNLVENKIANLALRNSAISFLNGREVYRYEKRGDFNEARYYGNNVIFMRGENTGACVIDGLRIGFEICYDHCANSLPDLIRPKLLGRLDLHIVISDYVANRDAPDTLLRDYGYKIHASTNAAVHGVWRKVNGRLQPVGQLCSTIVHQCPLSFSLINMIDDSLLADACVPELNLPLIEATTTAKIAEARPSGSRPAKIRRLE